MWYQNGPGSTIVNPKWIKLEMLGQAAARLGLAATGLEGICHSRYRKVWGTARPAPMGLRGNAPKVNSGGPGDGAPRGKSESTFHPRGPLLCLGVALGDRFPVVLDTFWKQISSLVSFRWLRLEIFWVRLLATRLGVRFRVPIFGVPIIPAY